MYSMNTQADLGKGAFHDQTPGGDPGVLLFLTPV